MWEVSGLRLPQVGGSSWRRQEHVKTQQELVKTPRGPICPRLADDMDIKSALLIVLVTIVVVYLLVALLHPENF